MVLCLTASDKSIFMYLQASHSWQRVPNPLFHKDPLHKTYLSLFHILPNSVSTVSFCYHLFIDIIDLHLWRLTVKYQRHLLMCFIEQGVKFVEGLP